MKTRGEEVKSPVHPHRRMPSVPFVSETEGEALGRYSGFGREIFEAIWYRFPHLRVGFEYYRTPRFEDVYSFCSAGRRDFSMQLDPDTQVICLSDGLRAKEFGHLPHEEPVRDALAWIADCA